jgi:5-methylcytosine-specific restriction enzyme A
MRRPPPFYKSAAWRRARHQALHDAGYRCRRCGADLIGKGRGAHVHHRKEYKRAPSLATEPLNLMPLCVGCHDAEHHRMKGNGSTACDIDGRPLDQSHPWFEKV